MTESTRVALIGAGPMARAYGHALKHLGIDTVVVGRGEASAAAFRDDVGLDVATGGLDSNADAVATCSHAIVATPVTTLADQAAAVTGMGVKKVLVEKPAGLNLGQIEGLAETAKSAEASIYVAYNRRFYASVREAKRRIEADGGPTSFRFEISEWAERVGASPNTDEVKRAWFLANSTHVIDMAFFLGGHPEQIEAMSAGSVGWHDPSVFVGHGRTASGALFSYHGDWGAAPRWMVEVCTAGHTYMFQPLEGLKMRTSAGFAVEDVDLHGEDDKAFKPGILRQTEAFVRGSPDSGLLSIADHARHVREIYVPMAGMSLG